MECSLIGPLYGFFAWHGKDKIHDSDRISLFTILTIIAFASTIIFGFLREPFSPKIGKRKTLKDAGDAFKTSVRLGMV